MKRTPLWLIMLVFFFSRNSFAQTAGDGQFYTSFDGTKIYYEVKGNGYPVILIHGFCGSGEGWKKSILYTNLIKGGYKVITLDLRGNG